jgi:cation:H+ antiporter
MLAALGLCIVGLAALTLGAELITRGGTQLAAKIGVSPVVIGLTVVAVGTSFPELAVGVDASLQGNGALAIGNIAGTNTVNLLLILGLSGLIRELPLHLRTLKLDLPCMIAAALMLFAFVSDGTLTRLDGAMLVLAGILYTGAILRSAQNERALVRAQFAEKYEPQKSWSDSSIAVTVLIVGIAIIVMGADWFVDGAVGLARIWRVSDAFIGLTIVAIGTSAPELVTTIVSTLRNQRDIAVGNLIGSSVYNIVFILGATALVPPGGIEATPNLIWIDIPVMIAATAACAPVFMTGRRVSRMEGGLFVTAYAAYLGYLLIART